MVTIGTQQIQHDAASQQSGVAGFSQRIEQAIQNAANRTGVNFAYLLNKAQQESGGDPNAKSSNSTATGLFQFTGQTWLQTLKAHGAQYGLGDYADHISIDNNGVARVNNPVWRNAILALRKDPTVSAEMAGELDKENSAALKTSGVGKIGATELYLAHFLGAGGASDFLKAMKANPNAPAANVLPDAADANQSVFYNSDGSARSLGQIYKHFAQKFDAPATTSTIMVASAAPPASASQAAQYAASAYTIAANTGASSYANYVSPVTNSLKADNASSMAAAVLAQMGFGDLNSASLPGGTHTHKGAISVLGAVA